MSIEQSPSARQDASALARFSPGFRRAITAFVKSGDADKAQRAAEAEANEERRGLLAELAAATKAYTGKVRPLETAAANAMRAYEEAEKALAVARSAMQATAHAANGNELTFLAEQKRIKDELRLTADPRIASFWGHLDNVRSEDLPSALDIRPNMDRIRGDRWAPAVVTNTAEVHAARVAVEAALPVVEALLYEPLGYVDVSQRLMSLCESLSKALAPARLNPPSLTAADAEPGPALMFREAPQWIVEEAVSARGEEVAARREAAASRIAASAKVHG